MFVILLLHLLLARKNLLVLWQDTINFHTFSNVQFQFCVSNVIYHPQCNKSSICLIQSDRMRILKKYAYSFDMEHIQETYDWLDELL